MSINCVTANMCRLLAWSVRVEGFPPALWLVPLEENIVVLDLIAFVLHIVRLGLEQESHSAIGCI